MKAIAYLSLTVTLSLGLALASPATAHPLTTQLAQAAASVGQTASDGDRYPVTSPAVTSGASAPPIIAPPSARFAPLGSAPTSRDGMGRLPSVAAAPRPFSSSGRPLAGGRVVSHPAKDRASQLVFQAQQQLLRGELESALRLAEQAQRLQVPKEAFGPQEMRPWQVLMEIERRRKGVVPASKFTLPQRAAGFPVRQGIYNPNTDPTSNMRAQIRVPTPARPPSVQPLGRQLFEQGMAALEGQDRGRALQLFREAWQHQSDLDPSTRQQLTDKLSLLSSARDLVSSGREPSPLEQVDTAQELLRQQLYGEFSIEENAADKQMKAEPFAALERMEKIRAKVGASDLSPGSQKQLLTLIDRKTIQFRSYIDQHRSEIEQDDRNAAILASIDRDKAIKSETQNKIAQLVEEYNDLIEEQRWKEAEVRAKQVRALDPDSPIARTLMINASFGYRIREQQNIAERSEGGFYRAMSNVGESAIAFNGNYPIDFGSVDNWIALNKSPYRGGEMKHRQLSPTEIKIQAALKERVQVRFTNRPLKEVLDDLGSMSNVNIYADPQGLSAEGVTSDTPITINLTEAVSLQSALKLILEPLRLSYVIQHEVLRVTSEQSGDANVYTDVYNVADLVIPIPNFVPGYNVGLPAAIREAHRALGYGDGIPSAMGPFTIAPTDLQGSVSTSASVLAQSNSFGLQSRSGSRPSTPLGYGNGSMGGAALADFGTLIELITSTIAPDTWDDVGGPGAIESFPTNLSLVISQTQDVHDQIADLLEQLRRLQDLQVTIEVRFITLRDDFSEQMGIDFDFDIDDNVTQLPQDDSGNSVAIGLDATGIPTADLDISFNQGRFAASQPAFGGFDAASAASIGFAILSDIEAFFVLQAAQGDQRSNVLQAPKVTLFNGQQASVSDTSQRPFVTSLIPVVGDFAAAHQPVIVVLSEGTSLSVQAVVSSDRRFVRLTLVPFFSQIGEVEEFTFNGTTTTDSGSNVVDPDGNPTAQDNVTTTTAGTTVQLPTFAFTTVSTTVSVPDGGTVLLGGIKRLREGRNEQGVPVLSKLPYINRLFKNVGIGRESQSLMLMVTPRIIIQEEEEEKLGIELTQ